MLYNSLPFLYLFFPLFFIAYFILAKTRLKNFVLLGGSIGFILLSAVPINPQNLRTFAMVNVPVLSLVVVANYFIGQRVEKKQGDNPKPSYWFIAGIGFNILLLVFAKIMVYLQQNIQTVALMQWIPDIFITVIRRFIMPVGISYITFQAIAYLIDIQKSITKSEKSLLSFSVFLLMFPKLLTGPIVQYKKISGELKEHLPSSSMMAEGLQRFVIGLAKKSLIADQLARITVPFFGAAHPDFSFGITWLVLIAYTLQIYYDFSGYTDMAIGMGAMLGFKLPENFRRPYAALNLSDFWRRWHITLSSWFREYVFFPLEFSRKRVKRFRIQTDILIVFLLTGLWHGINPTFIIWGLWQGLVLVFETSSVGQWLKGIPTFFQRMYFFAVVMIGWAIFRSPTLQFAYEFILDLTGLRKPQQMLPFARTNPLPIIDPSLWLILFLAIILLFPWKDIVEKYNQTANQRLGFYPVKTINFVFIALLLLLSLSAIAASTQFASIYAMF